MFSPQNIICLMKESTAEKTLQKSPVCDVVSILTRTCDFLIEFHKRITLKSQIFPSCFWKTSPNVMASKLPSANHRRTFFAIFFLLMMSFASAIQYTAPDDCDWTSLSVSDVALTCRLQTIVSTGVLATNFSLIQPEHTTTLTIFCDPVFFESNFAHASLSHLRFLKSLRIEQCKLQEIPQEAFRGLGELRNLSIRTFNSEWGAFPLQLLPGSLLDLRQVESLDLGYNKIESLPEEDLCSLSFLKVLNLTHNELTEFVRYDGKNDTHKSCFHDLTELDMSHNNIASIANNAMEPLRNLRVLVLRSNHLVAIGGSSLVGFEKLQILDMSDNRLSNIPSKLFQDSPDVRELYFQNNSILSLPSGLFTGLQQLLVLNFSYNHISSDSVGADTFIDLIRLVILDLSHNQLHYVNSSVFQSQYSLQMLFLNHNAIEMIADNSFSALFNLHTLDLSHNNLKYLDVFTLNGLYVISYLQLSYNHIYSVHPDAFKNCSSVQDLSLQGNNLSHVPSALSSLQFLKTLDLSNNSITDLTNASFRGLRQLQKLNLSMNKIGNLTRGSFRHMPSLSVLNLSKNKIQALGQGIFDDVGTLNRLDLSDNELTDINGLFMYLNNLKHLNVSRNKITWFDYAFIRLELEELDLHSNQIETLGNYYELEAIMKLNYLDVSYNLIKEINGASFPNHIEKIRLNNNNINIINAFTFMSKINLESVNITNNNLQNLDINAFRLNPVTLANTLPQFSISGNPYFCDCNMEWLQHMNILDGTSQYPLIVDLNEVVCQLQFTRHTTFLSLSKANSSDFLCKYRSHCFALCHCCEFDACDCEMVCPENCTCYSDQTWNTNIVDCSSRGFASMPSAIPMDVTDLYLDGNSILQLTSHTFIGRKNMRIIFLNNSNIHTINNRTFNGLLALRVLHLEHNKLTVLHGFEFETLIHLKELYLSNNHIGFVTNTTFQNLKSLEILHLDHNLIMEFQVWNLNWNSRLSHVQLGHNPWTCNCQYLESYHEWLHSVSSVVHDTGSIRCRHNQSAGPYVLEFNVSTCSNYTAITYFQAVFQADYMPIMIIAPTVFFVLLLFVVLGCVYRKEMKIWVFSKYGIRLFHRNHFTPETEKLFDAFVSYSKKDEAFVSQILAPEMECGAPSYRLCLRYRDLPMSGYVAEAITEAIECSHRTVIVLSEQFLKSEWCRFELKSAHRETQCNRKHRLIVIVLDKVSFKQIDPDAKMCFRNAPIIRWGDKRFWEKLRYAMPDGQGQNAADPKLPFPHQRLPHSNSVKLV